MSRYAHTQILLYVNLRYLKPILPAASIGVEVEVCKLYYSRAVDDIYRPAAVRVVVVVRWVVGEVIYPPSCRMLELQLTVKTKWKNIQLTSILSNLLNIAVIQSYNFTAALGI